jgi:hypothetical protein
MDRRAAWPLAALLLVLAAAPAPAFEWSPGDVAAAERYREVERERALRYRAVAARSSDGAGRAEPRREARPRRPVSDSISVRIESWLAELDRAGAALIAWITAGERAGAAIAAWITEVERASRPLVAWVRGDDGAFRERRASPPPERLARRDRPGWLAEERDRLRRAGLERLATRAP